jgi:hypothetical protein
MVFSIGISRRGSSRIGRGAIARLLASATSEIIFSLCGVVSFSVFPTLI